MFQATSRWESFVWPRWLPERARLPLIAQITAAVSFTALMVGPWWSRIPEGPALPESRALSPMAPFASAVPTSPSLTELDAARATPVAPSARPAHLNLDVRHSFGSVDLSVDVDGTAALNTELGGSGKRFKMFGKRAERGFTRTLDLAPGVRVVRIRIRSKEDKFDQTRVERFDLSSASVAAISINADKNGMSIVADRPPAPPAPKAPAASIQDALPAIPLAAATVLPVAATAARSPQTANAVIGLVQSLRSMLIAIAGFVASAATGFVVQEFMRRRKNLLFAGNEGPAQPIAPERRRRRRGTVRVAREVAEPAPDAEPSV